jgi:hypothetical protein
LLLRLGRSFAIAPSQQSQVDWGQVRVQCDAGAAKIHVSLVGKTV